MSKGVKSNSEVKNTSLIKEVTGMALVLFAVLAFLCYITGDALFYTLGAAVQGFLLGAFGYYAVFFLFDAALFGVLLTTGRSLVPRDKRKKYFALRVAVFAIYAMINLAVSHKSGLNFGEQVAAAYKDGSGGFSGAAVFGSFGTIFTASILTLVSVFGSYALYSVVALLSLFYVFGKRIIDAFSQEKKNKKVKKRPVPQSFEPAEEDEPSRDAPSEPYFFDEDGEFLRKSKKDIQSGAVNEYTFFEGEFYFKNIDSDPKADAPLGSRVAPSDGSDTDGRIDLRTRKDSVGDMGRDFSDYGYKQRTVGDYDPRSDVSDVIPREPRVSGGFEETDDDRRVYTIPLTDGERPRTVISSDTSFSDGEKPHDGDARSARGFFEGDFSETSDDYSDVFEVDNDEDEGFNAHVGEIKTFKRDDEPDPASYDEGEYEDSSAPARTAATRAPSAPPAPAPAPTRVSFGFGSAEETNKHFEVVDDGSEPIENMPDNYKYNPPPITLLKDYVQDAQEMWEERQRQSWCAETIVKVIKNKKNIDVKVENVVTGCAVTRFDISIPEPYGPSDIFSLRQDLAFRLQTGDELRMYSIPFTSHVGIEIANIHQRAVGLKDSLLSEDYAITRNKNGLFFVFGEDILGNKIILDINLMPHLLVCGTTGSGKSVCLNVLLISLMYRYSPEELRLIIVDPKMVEFESFKGIPHLMFNEILGTDERTVSVLEWCVYEMNRRYNILKERECKEIAEYNKLKNVKKMPYVIVLIDEYAELVMAQQQNKKRIEHCVERLSQKARAAGISLILATQRASVSIISGTIKTNIVCRICFQTASAVDSRVILDEQGGEKLLGKGDALYKIKGQNIPKRGKGAFMSNDEVKTITSYIKENNKCYFDNKLLQAINDSVNQSEQPEEGQRVRGLPSRPDEVDEDYKLALRFAIKRQVVSGSSLRTVLRIGYNKSASIIAWMEKMGYISPILENKMRKVYFTREDYESVYGEFTEDDL